MMTKLRLPLAALLAVSSATAVAFADELKDVEKKILAAWDNHKSATANMTVVVHDFHPQKGFFDYKAKGTAILLRHKGKTLVRMERKFDHVEFANGKTEKTDNRGTIVADGQYVYTLNVRTTPRAEKSAFKRTDWIRDACPDPKRMFELIHEAQRVMLLPGETIDGKRVYVIGTRCEQRGSLYLYYFLQDDGALVKSEEYLSDSRTTGPPGRWIRHEFSDVKFDVDIGPQRFVFEPPEGVELVDRTDDGAGAPQSNGARKRVETQRETHPLVEAWAKVAEPGPSHRLLDYFVGQWDVSVRFWPGDGGNGLEGKGASWDTWVLGGRFVRQYYAGEFIGTPVEGLGYIGYDSTKGKFVWVWMSTFNTGVLTLDGSYDRRDRQFIFEGLQELEGKKRRWLVKLQIISDNEYVVSWHQSLPGQLALSKTEENVCKRITEQSGG